ncbi:transcriptional regulator/sugar kinase [Cryptosporangium arvum DSM 44712]|uniref:Transcriptional regulator/sugar kinase n=1 Tax=Cryptosporangium arvum DSM 44712 TaxID=927661 RepID=A0A011AHF4_9ACTN|nr:ROK family transcriptional regulator [Cryptosporangium arvum]EXG81451.1 transcriptional regulator/sugar kinase [Cryptosporangium arvum DSM 44712]
MDVLSGRTTNRALRRQNRATLLSALFLDGPLSRQDLTARYGLSQAAVSNVIADLMDDGLVVEAGALESDGGRPRILLRVSPDYASVIGVDVGETRVRVELFDLAMTPLAKADYPLEDLDPRSVVRHVRHGIESVAGGNVLGVGVGVSGLVEQGDQAVVHAQTLGWDAVPLERMLREGTDLPLHLDNGAKTWAQAEHWFGAGRGARHAAFALVGSGVGAAIVADGQSYRGASSSAGEWGHTTLVYGGRACRCGARGCLEAYVGAESIIARALEAGVRVEGPDEETQVASVLADPAAAGVLAETAAYLGAGVANLINLFNPERVVIGGWAGIALGPLLPQVREAAAAQAMRRPFAQASIELCALGTDAVALGAATLPVARLLAAGGVRD